MSGFIKAVHQTAIAGPITWTVPANQCWQLMVGHIVLTTSATGGNRWLHLEIKSPDGHVVWDQHSGIKQGSSLVRQYNFRSGDGRETAFIDNDLILTIPRFAVLLPNYVMTLRDADAIDTGNDTFSVHGLIMVTTGSNLTVDKII